MQSVMVTIFNCLHLLTFITLSLSSEFSLKGDPCSKFDSCNSKSVLKTCSCDSSCHEYGNCCQDMRKPARDAPGDTFQCYSRKTINPVFVMRSCSKDFRGHVGDERACFDDDEDEMDVRNNLLVTSRKTKISYWNKHCGLCNNEAATDLEFWNIEVYCSPHKEIDRSLIRRNLTFDQDRRQWGFMIGDEFVHCFVKYTPPPYNNEVKYCTSNIITSCPGDYKNEGISAKCSQYCAERKVKNSDIYFKNIHCAICNGAAVKELECPGMRSPKGNIEESDFRGMVEDIFSNGEWLEKEPGKRFECSRGFSYDPMREKCRRYENEQEETMMLNSANFCRTWSLIILVALITILL